MWSIYSSKTSGSLEKIIPLSEKPDFSEESYLDDGVNHNHVRNLGCVHHLSCELYTISSHHSLSTIFTWRMDLDPPVADK